MPNYLCGENELMFQRGEGIPGYWKGGKREKAPQALTSFKFQDDF